MIDAEFTLHGPARLGAADFPIAIAYGDRDFLCSKGADDLVRASRHFRTGKSQLFKVADSSHFLH